MEFVNHNLPDRRLSILLWIENLLLERYTVRKHATSGFLVDFPNRGK